MQAAGNTANRHARIRGTANPEYARAIADIRKSNAAGVHRDRRERRARTREAQIRKALKDV